MSVVFVTGSSRGIGLSVVKMLLSDGHKVASLARSRPAEVEALEAIYGADLLVIEGDLADPATATAAVRATISTFSRVDALVFNAATLSPLKRLADATLEEILTAFNVNVFSIIPVIQASVPELRKSKRPGGARIVVVSSSAGLAGKAGMATYCASKAALNSFVGALGQEEESIVTVAVNPGMVETQMAEEMRRDVNGKTSLTDRMYQWMVNSYTPGGNKHPDVAARAIVAVALHAGKELSGRYLDWDALEVQALWNS